MKKIKIVDIKIDKHDIYIDYEIDSCLSVYFNLENKFHIHYDEDISTVTKSVAVIPFITNILPLVWLTDATLEVEELDKDFYESLDKIKEGYAKMYPLVEWRGKYKVAKKIKNSPKSNRYSIFFSGGIDSTASLLRVLERKPILITIWGSDIWEHDVAGWENAKDTVDRFAKYFRLDTMYLKSNFRKFIQEGELNKNFSSLLNDSWWHGVQHGIGLLGHVAILSYVYGIKTHYIPATYTKEDGKVTCASYPTIDENVRFCGCNIIHEGFDITRQQKIDLISNYFSNKQEKIDLRVCYMERGNKMNCCHCEKCYRTIMGLIASGADPQEYGFEVDEKLLKSIPKEIASKKFLSKATITLWLEIQQKFLKNKSEMKYPKNVRWIYHFDFVNQKKRYFKKIKLK